MNMYAGVTVALQVGLLHLGNAVKTYLPTFALTFANTMSTAVVV